MSQPFFSVSVTELESIGSLKMGSVLTLGSFTRYHTKICFLSVKFSIYCHPSCYLCAKDRHVLLSSSFLNQSKIFLTDSHDQTALVSHAIVC